MSTRTAAADRSRGGPGSSHERKDRPGGTATRDSGGHHNAPPAPGEATNPDRSQVSGGGGERDRHHTHDPATKS